MKFRFLVLLTIPCVLSDAVAEVTTRFVSLSKRWQDEVIARNRLK